MTAWSATHQKSRDALGHAGVFARRLSDRFRASQTSHCRWSMHRRPTQTSDASTVLHQATAWLQWQAACLPREPMRSAHGRCGSAHREGWRRPHRAIHVPPRDGRRPDTLAGCHVQRRLEASCLSRKPPVTRQWTVRIVARAQRPERSCGRFVH